MTKDENEYYYEAPGSFGDNIKIYFRDRLHIAIEEPLAGCTETGFGAATSIELDREQAQKVYELIGRFLAQQEATDD